MYSLFATAFNQFRNRPRAILDASGLCWRHADGLVRLAEVIVGEVQCNRYTAPLE